VSPPECRGHELLADHVDHAQRNVAQFSADRTERAAEPQGVDAEPHQRGHAGVLHRGIDALAAGDLADNGESVVAAGVD